MKVLDVAEANALIVKVAEQIDEIIKVEMEKVHPSQRYVITGRILNLLYTEFFGASLLFTREHIEKLAKEIGI